MRVKLFMVMLICGSLGCAAIDSAESWRPVADETLTLGMTREQVEGIIGDGCRYREFEMGNRFECRYEDQDSWPFRTGIYFVLWPADVFLWWLEQGIQDSNQRWSSGFYDSTGELIYFKSENRGGNSVIELGGWKEKLPKPKRHHTFYQAVFGD